MKIIQTFQTKGTRELDEFSLTATQANLLMEGRDSEPFDNLQNVHLSVQCVPKLLVCLLALDTKLEPLLIPVTKAESSHKIGQT